MTKPLVSVIVPIYNVAPYLHECINSIVNQIYRNLEIILVDDGSTDNSGEICDNFAQKDSRIRVIHKHNQGLTSSRNIGIQMSTGDWITHVDGDDHIEADAIAKLIEEAEKTDAEIVIGGLNLFWEERNEEVKPIIWGDNKITDLRRYIISHWTCLCGSIAKRNLYVRHNIKAPIGLTWHEDFFYMSKLMFHARKISSIDNALYNYRQRPNSIMNSWNDAMINSAMTVINSIQDYFNNAFDCFEFNRELTWRKLNILQNSLRNYKRYDDIREVTKCRSIWIMKCPYLTTKRKFAYLAFKFGVNSLLTK